MELSKSKQRRAMPAGCPYWSPETTKGASGVLTSSRRILRKNCTESKDIFTLPTTITTYLLSISSNSQINITKGSSTDPLGNTVFLFVIERNKGLESKHSIERRECHCQEDEAASCRTKHVESHVQRWKTALSCFFKTIYVSEILLSTVPYCTVWRSENEVDALQVQ